MMMVPVATMEGIGEGVSDFHYGNNVELTTGHHITVTVTLNGQRAVFHTTVPKAARSRWATGAESETEIVERDRQPPADRICAERGLTAPEACGNYRASVRCLARRACCRRVVW